VSIRNRFIAFALTAAWLVAACGQNAAPPSAASLGAGADNSPSAGDAIEDARIEQSRQPVVLADGSRLSFRSSVDRRVDNAPLADIEILRVLVNYNRTDFFVNGGQPHGFEYEYVREFEHFLNQRLRRTANPIHFEFVITDLERVLPDLTEGRGDIAAANLTITPLRNQKVDFSQPYLTSVDELVVTHRNVPAPATLDALGGKRVLVPRGSSYAEHLTRLARAQREAGLTPVEVVEADGGLESEDILELVNAGIVDYTIVDSHRARLWAQVLPHIVVRENAVVNPGGSIAWAVRPESRELLAALDAFIRQDGARSAMNRMLFDRYFRDTRWIVNPATRPMLRRQASVIDAIKKYSEADGLDWRLVLAHAAAESDFDHSRRGANGAIGVMQVTPEMAEEVGVTDIEQPDRNIEAGVHYLAKLRNDYARETGAEDQASMDLALAAYRVGPEQVRTLQNYARALGLDPAKWEKNVALVADLTLGDSPAREVDKVRLYLEAYRLNDAEAARVRPSR
jgi:membrane-bound lytic murein transglycosylase MltF